MRSSKTCDQPSGHCSATVIVDRCFFFQNLRVVYTSCKYFKFEKIPFSIFSGGHIFKGFDGQTWWFVNFTHFPLTDYF